MSAFVTDNAMFRQLLNMLLFDDSRLTSQLRHHSRSSDSALRHFCSPAHTLTLSVNLQTMYFFSTPVWT